MLVTAPSTGIRFWCPSRCWRKHPAACVSESIQDPFAVAYVYISCPPFHVNPVEHVFLVSCCTECNRQVRLAARAVEAAPFQIPWVVFVNKATDRRESCALADPHQEKEMCAGLRERYEAHHKLRYTDEALMAAATYSHQYISDRFLPDKAIDLIDEAGSRVRLRHAQLPEEAREVEKELRKIQKEKDGCVRTQVLPAVFCLHLLLLREVF